MNTLLRWIAAVARRFWRLGLRLTWLLGLTCLAIVFGFTLYAVGALPSLQPWHTERLREEFNARRHGEIDFAGYLLREAKLFDELREKVATWDASDEALVYSRFNATGRLSLLVEGAPYNRSFRLTPAQHSRECVADSWPERFALFDEGASRILVRTGLRGDGFACARARHPAVDDD